MGMVDCAVPELGKVKVPLLKGNEDLDKTPLEVIGLLPVENTDPVERAIPLFGTLVVLLLKGAPVVDQTPLL